jgi:hypothetical protein
MGILKKGNRLKILFIERRNYDYPPQFKQGESHIGLLGEDFTEFCVPIKIGDFKTDLVVFIQPTDDGRLIVSTETSYFLIELV